MVAQGEIWWTEAEFGRRPVLVVTRSQAVPVLRQLLIAPITRRARRIPTELPMGPEEGLAEGSVASFDNLSLLPQALLTERVGQLGIQRRDEICDALAALADC